MVFLKIPNVPKGTVFTEKVTYGSIMAFVKRHASTSANVLTQAYDELKRQFLCDVQ